MHSRQSLSTMMDFYSMDCIALFMVNKGVLFTAQHPSLPLPQNKHEHIDNIERRPKSRLLDCLMFFSNTLARKAHELSEKYALPYT